MKLMVLAQNNFTGNVKDVSGEPLIGVSVIEIGTSNGTVTDVEGNFSIVANPKAKLRFSYIGYTPLEVKASEASSIILKEDAKALNEVVVIGYGTTSKARATGSIAQLKAEKISNAPVASFEEAIAGQLPGVSVMQQSGTPGKSSAMKIRGSSSITAGTNPLIVIDGFPSTSDDLSSINPEDIESIDVLKDASSAAIYGSRGANGVVVVSTKKGSTGKPKISAKAYYGVQSVSKTIDMMNAYEYAQFVATARNNYWIDQNPSVNKATDSNDVRTKKAKIPDYLQPYLNNEKGLTDTDWQDEIFRQAAIQQYSLSVAGGTNKFSYYTSLSYFDQDGVVENTGFKRVSARSNIHAEINKNLSFELKMAPSYSSTRKVSESNHKQDGVVLMTMIANPAAAAYNEDGSLLYGDQIEKGQTWGTAAFESPLATALSINDKVGSFNFLSNLNLTAKIIDNLTFKSNFGIEYNHQEEDYFRPSYLGSYNSKAPSKATGKNWGYTTTNWVWENTLNYKLELGDHFFDFLLGQSAQKENYNTTYIAASDFPNDNITTLNAGIVNDGYTKKTAWTLLSYFARINYAYQNKYLLSASIRTDGSSRFGKNNRYGTFPSVSLGWRIIEEKWMKDSKQNFFSDLKLRASYGGTGNFQISNYGSYALLESANYVYNENVANGLYPATAPNPNIGWEKTSQWNVGLDFSLFHNKLNFTMDFYNSKTSGMLLDVPVPGASGFTTSLQNIGKVRNRGFEISANAEIGNEKFKWTPSFNFSTNDIEVLELGPNQTQILSGVSLTKVGGQIGEYYLYNIIGVYKSEEDLAKYPHLSTAKIGSYIYEDVDNNGLIDDGDRKVMGSYNPDFTLGFNNTFTYKDFDLSVNIQWIQGVEIFNKQNAFLYNEEGWGIGAKKLYNNWYSEENVNAKYARPLVSPTDKLYESSNYMMEDGSFVRFNNITLGYTLPKKLANKIMLNSVRIYATAHNLFTITNYSGYNPEVSSSSDPLTPGIDYGGYPVNKSIVLGLNINF